MIKHNFKKGAHAKKREPKKAKKPLADANIQLQCKMLQLESFEKDEGGHLIPKVRKNSAEHLNENQFDQFNSFKVRKQSAELTQQDILNQPE